MTPPAGWTPPRDLTHEEMAKIARRAFVRGAAFNINSLDPECPYGAELPDTDGEES